MAYWKVSSASEEMSGQRGKTSASECIAWDHLRWWAIFGDVLVSQQQKFVRPCWWYLYAEARRRRRLMQALQKGPEQARWLAGSSVLRME